MDGNLTPPSEGPFANSIPFAQVGANGNLFADELTLDPCEADSLSNRELVGAKPKGVTSEGSSLFDNELSWACPKKIHEWTDRANINFKYTKKKIDELVTKAKKKMAEKSDCYQLECTQCNESFLDESELRRHFNGEDHLEKVREKSESKTLGDLKTFARVVLPKSPPTNQLSTTTTTTTTNQSLLGDSFDLCAEADGIGIFAHDDASIKSFDAPLNSGLPKGEEMESDMSQRGNAADVIAELQKKVERLVREVAIPMPVDELQKIIVGVKLKEDEMGYELPNDKYYKLMMMSGGDFSSRKEQMENIVKCCVNVKRKGGNYGERSEEERAPPKRKRKK